jgi:translocation and assembly module TamB
MADSTVKPESEMAKTRKWGWRHAIYLSAAVVALIVIAAAAMAWYVSTPRFAARVRQALVSTLQQATGGTVQIDAFHWNPRHLTAEVGGLTIHGREAAGGTEAADEAPYFHVDRLFVKAKIVSLFLPRITLAQLVAERPVFHLIVYPDGTTNQPHPRSPSGSATPKLLLNMAIDHTRIENGLILVNNRAIPWEMSSGPLQLTMRHAWGGGYRAKIETRNLTFRLKDAVEAHSRLAASILLKRRSVRLESLDLGTGRSHLSATALVEDFSRPKWNLSAQGAIDLAGMGALLGEDGLRQGTARVEVQAHGEPHTDKASGSTDETFQIVGRADLHSAAWESPRLDFRNFDLHARVFVDNDQCSIPEFSALLEDGGRVAGSLTMKHCVGTSVPADQVSALRKPGATRGSAFGTETLLDKAREKLKRLRGRFEERASRHPHRKLPLEAKLKAQFSGITLPMILAGTAPKEYWNIGFTTAASGKVTAHWTGDGRGLDVHGDVTMSAPPSEPGLAPVTGSAVADYLGDSHRLQIQQADLQLPAATIHASGLLTLRDSDPHSALHLDVTGHNLGNFDRLLTDLDRRETPPGAPHALPVELLGDASFHGTMLGSFFAPGVSGRVDAQRFRVAFWPTEGTNQTSGSLAVPIRMDWDRFHGNLNYAPSHLTLRDAEVVHGSTAIHGSLELTPDRAADGDYHYGRKTRIALSASTQRASAADLQPILEVLWGKSLRHLGESCCSISGTLGAEVHLAGTLEDLSGRGEATIAHGAIQGQAIREASIHWIAANHSFQATAMRVSLADGHAAGHGSYNSETGAIQGELTGKGLLLDRLSILRGTPRGLGGVLGFAVQASGTTTNPVASGDFRLDRIAFRHRSIGNASAQAHLSGRVLSIDSQARLLDAPFRATGQVLLKGEYPAQARLQFTGVDVAPILRAAGSKIAGLPAIRGSSSIDGEATLSGPLAKPEALLGKAELKPFTVVVDGRPIRSIHVVEASLHGGKLQLQPARLQGQDSDIVVQGNADLLDHGTLNFHTEGSVNAALASAFNPEIQSSGQLGFVADVRGTAHHPYVQGRADIRHINLHLANVTTGLTDMNGEVAFEHGRLAIQQLKGYSGGGALDLKGFVSYGRRIFIDVAADANHVRIRYPKGISSSINANVRLQGTPDNLLLSGNAKLVRFDIVNSFDLASLLSSGNNAPRAVNPTSLLNRVRLDVQLTSAPELGFQNSYASLTGDVNLRIRGTMENPSILGRIGISRGTASFAGTQYRLQQGEIAFHNPVAIAPEIDLEATSRVQNYDIIITLHGTPSKMNVSYRSEPPLSQSDVLALLALGRTNEQAVMYGEQQQANANLTTEALLGGALNAAVSSRVQKLFGVGSVRVDPNFVGTLGESTARVTVGEQVGRKLTLTFATNVNTTAQQLIQAQYDLGRNISIVAVRDEADIFSMYLQFRGRHR